MRRRVILAVACALALAATVWFAIEFVGAGQVVAGRGGRDRVAIPDLRRRERVEAGVRYAGALILIGAGSAFALRRFP